MTISTPYFGQRNEFQKRKFIFFVEGLDDVFFLSQLFSELKFSIAEVGIVQVEGKENFGKNIRQFLKTAAFITGVSKSVCVICDADESPQSALNAFNAELAVTNTHAVPLGGFATSSKGVRFGFFAFPDSSNSGDLEKLCLDTVSGSNLEISAQDFISNALARGKETGDQLQGSIYKRKAQVYLSGHKGEICRGVGRAYAKGIFEHDHLSLQPLKTFLLKAIS